MTVKKKRIVKRKKKVVCNNTVEAVIQALTSPAVISAAGQIVQMLRSSGGRR